MLCSLCFCALTVIEVSRELNHPGFLFSHGVATDYISRCFLMHIIFTILLIAYPNYCPWTYQLFFSISDNSCTSDTATSHMGSATPTWTAAATTTTTESLWSSVRLLLLRTVWPPPHLIRRHPRPPDPQHLGSPCDLSTSSAPAPATTEVKTAECRCSGWGQAAGADTAP